LSNRLPDKEDAVNKKTNNNTQKFLEKCFIRASSYSNIIDTRQDYFTGISSMQT